MLVAVDVVVPLWEVWFCMKARTAKASTGVSSFSIFAMMLGPLASLGAADVFSSFLRASLFSGTQSKANLKSDGNHFHQLP